ncbi:MAG: energy-coupling factor transporter transmembrane protein EcfT [Spirochaetales bacterium]|nr:energy-coupling factor transporter transmembrane protein EcfT [Spirochaetales bacterium]
MTRTPTFLSRVNPLTRAAVSVAYIVVATVGSSATLSALWLVAVCGATLGLTTISLRTLLVRMAPFAVVGLGFVWTNLFFHRSGEVAVGLRAGGALMLRALVFGGFSLFFVLDMDRETFAHSLIRFLHAPPRLVYAVIIAFRLLPILRAEFVTIRLALTLRGIPRTRRLVDRVGALKTVLSALFVASIRRAQRLAVSLEARGLDDGPRTFLTPPRLGRRDAIFATVAFICMVLSLRLVSWESWNGRFV